MKETYFMGMVCTVDNFGKVILPSEIRRKLGINEGDVVNVFTNADGAIILRKEANGNPTCSCPCANAEKNKRIHTFVSEYTNDVKVIRISEEQEKLLDYLIDNDLFSCDYSHDVGYPEATDLT